MAATLATSTHSDDERFEAAVARLETVLEDVHVSGSTDHQLRIACRDTAEPNATIRALRRECGAAETDARIVLHQSLNRRAASRGHELLAAGETPR